MGLDIQRTNSQPSLGSTKAAHISTDPLSHQCPALKPFTALVRKGTKRRRVTVDEFVFFAQLAARVPSVAGI